MFPTARWKKHGLTDPSTSTTAETQGALQIGDSGEACPRCSRNRRGIRRSFSAASAMYLRRISSACSTMSCSISSSSAGNLLRRQRDLTLSLSWPNQRPIECFRSQIGREKGDGIKSDRFGRRYGSAKMAMIGFLHRSAAGYPQIRLSRYELRQRLCAITSNAPVTRRMASCTLSRTVDRDDHVIEERGDLVGALEQQQACG